MREARQETKSVKEENEALRYQCCLREDEFRTEERERRRAQAELQSTRAQLQQLSLQRQTAERQVFTFHHLQSTGCDNELLTQSSTCTVP